MIEQISSPVYLADGREIRASIQFPSDWEETGTIEWEGKIINVGPLAAPWEPLGYGEIIPVTLHDGKTHHTTFGPEEYHQHVASFWLSLDQTGEQTMCLLDKTTGTWREFTEVEYQQEYRALEADHRDMAQIDREWREYRTQGLGKRG